MVPNKPTIDPASKADTELPKDQLRILAVTDFVCNRFKFKDTYSFSVRRHQSLVDLANLSHHGTCNMSKCKLGIIMAGHGDYKLSNTNFSAQLFEVVNTLAQQAQANSPEFILMGIATTPSVHSRNLGNHIAKINDEIKKFCDKYDKLMYFGDANSVLCPDGVPNPEFWENDFVSPVGFNALAAQIRGIIRRKGIFD